MKEPRTDDAIQVYAAAEARRPVFKRDGFQLARVPAGPLSGIEVESCGNLSQRFLLDA